MLKIFEKYDKIKKQEKLRYDMAFRIGGGVENLSQKGFWVIVQFSNLILGSL